MVNFKTLRLCVCLAVSIAFLTACNQNSSTSPKPEMQYFDDVETTTFHYYELVKDGNVVTSTVYKHYSNSIAVNEYSMSVVFTPVPMVVVRGVNTDVHDFYYLDSPQTPESLKAFWHVIYERATEDAAVKGYTVAEPLVAVDTVSLEDYEAQIAELQDRIAALEEAEAELKAYNAEQQAALRALQSEKENLSADLAEVTKQRDAYKAHIENFKANMPSFETTTQ